MEAIIYQWLTFLLPPFTGIITWFVSRRVRNANTLQRMQESIDMLVLKNQTLIKEVTELRSENSNLKVAQEQIVLEMRSLRSENEKLRKLVQQKHVKK